MKKDLPGDTTFLFNGAVTAISPFATCSPSLSKQSTSTEPKKVPSMRLREGERTYIPGQGVRSKLRGALTHLAGQAVKAVGGEFSLDDAQYLRLGGVKQSGTEAAISPVEMKAQLLRNPLISLFGASTPWITGKVMIGHAVDDMLIEKGVYEPIVIDGVRADPLRRDPELLSYLNDDAPAQLADIAKKVKFYSALKKEILALERQVKACKDAKEKASLKKLLDDKREQAKDPAIKIVSTQMPLAGYEAIPPGALLSHKMRLLKVNQIELGAFLAALDELARQPLLGAHKAHGCGEVSAQWTVVIPGSGTVGTVSFKPDWGGIQIDETDGVLAGAMGAFYHALQSGRFDFAYNPTLSLEAVEEEKGGQDEGDANE